ncbi:MAG: GMC family oxidoreductase [Myxococcales bacterium]|nr:GMC family oxidoreductase [Myxococcales bacterium]
MVIERSAEICIVGSGIVGILAAEKLAEEYDVSVLVIEAGGWIEREHIVENRSRSLAYDEHPYPGDHVPGLIAEGAIGNTMVVGGAATHWGGGVPRFSPEDFRLRSLTGTGDDWPIEYADLEPFYLEAERRIGVSGEPDERERALRSGDYPMPPLPLTENNRVIKQWLDEDVGLANVTMPKAINSVPYGGRGQCIRCNTCNICPSGARYSPDHALRRLVESKRVEVLERTFVRRLELRDGSSQIGRVVAIDRDTGEELSVEARHFLIAGGYFWSPHLLRASTSPRFPEGLANSSGLVGHYITGHVHMSHLLRLARPMFLGQQGWVGRLSREYMTVEAGDPCRFGLFFYEAGRHARPPMRLLDEHGGLRLGTELLAEWRAQRRDLGFVSLVLYGGVPAWKESRVLFDPARKTPWGDPLPMVNAVANDGAREAFATPPPRLQRFNDRLDQHAEPLQRLVLLASHPCGGCRMGEDPGTSVCDPFGRTHDHDNLWILGAPTCVSGGVVNATLTFVSLGLRTVDHLGQQLRRRKGAEAAHAPGPE